jgi:hypothetical protein
MISSFFRSNIPFRMAINAAVAEVFFASCRGWSEASDRGGADQRNNEEKSCEECVLSGRFEC